MELQSVVMRERNTDQCTEGGLTVSSIKIDLKLIAAAVNAYGVYLQQVGTEQRRTGALGMM